MNLNNDARPGSQNGIASKMNFWDVLNSNDPGRRIWEQNMYISWYNKFSHQGNLMNEKMRNDIKQWNSQVFVIFWSIISFYFFHVLHMILSHHRTSVKIKSFFI